MTSPGLATTYRYRPATSDDAAAIFAVLKEIAPEIPVLLDNSGRQMKIFEQIHGGIASGEVWVALDRDNQIIGFLLAEPDKRKRFFHENQALELSYGGVKPGHHRGKYIFSTLAKKIIAKGVPLTATVKHANKSDMVSHLLKLGFTKAVAENESFPDQDSFRWQP